jgi:hypothetical protein
MHLHGLLQDRFTFFTEGIAGIVLSRVVVTVDVVCIE